MSLFELPVSRGARSARIAAVLVLNLVLMGAGIAMIYSYWQDRQAAARAGGDPSDARAPAVEPVPEIAVAQPQQVEGTRGKPEIPTPAPSGPARPKRSDPASKPPTARAPTDRAPPPATPDAAPIATPPPADGERDTASTHDDDDPVASDPTGGGTGDTPGDDTTPPDDDDDTELTAGEVRQVVNRHFTQLKRCYQQAAKVMSPSDPLQGRLDIQFTIMPDGTAANVRAVANSTGSDQLATCVVTLVESWEFPSPGVESIDFIWPFEFKAPT